MKHGDGNDIDMASKCKSAIELDHDTIKDSIKSSSNERNSNLRFENLNEHNIQDLKSLNSIVIPIRYSSKFYKKILFVGSGVVAIDNKTSKVIGGSSCFSQDNGAALYICTIGVYASWRRKGIGSLIIQRLINKAQDMDQVKYLSLHCKAYDDDAIAFYKSNGFTIVNQIEKFYQKSRGRDAAAVEMRRPLKK